MTAVFQAPEVPAKWQDYRTLFQAEAQLAPEAWTFKGHPACRQFIETVTQEQGDAYFRLLSQRPDWATLEPLVRRTVDENDALGQPILLPSLLGLVCAPTNLRYAWQACTLADHIRALELEAADVLELGGGYGGLALYLYRLFPEILWSHSIVDLPEAGDIQYVFCRQFAVPVQVVDGPDAIALRQAVNGTKRARRVFVSCYGFGEFPPAWRLWYADRLARHCPHGFVLWNWTAPYAISDPVLSPMTIVDEPVFTELGTKVVTW